ncbi:hypothetical protein PsorP6_017741 [Peronosclerospora sorghi]|uniref:Uncharacterized protein n=1 Tax=Peronosclerospora sorghi TaxID=230839 RepID=A0ACC0WKR6_9STRA|nr:hypothetical protein PsorP6_017741 [Peronosclerospora sorghi]
MIYLLLTLFVTMPSILVASENVIYSGYGKPYSLATLSAGSCGFMYDPAGGDHYAAINIAQWDATRNCGRCADVSSDDKTVVATVYIVDECRDCRKGDLGLSPTLLHALGSDPSRHSIKWKLVDCPVKGNVKYCTHSLSNSSWVAVQPANAVTGVATMKVANQEATRLESSYFFLLPDGGNRNLSALDIELVSISGETITDKVSLTAGTCTSGSKNFKGSADSILSSYFKPASGYRAGHVTSQDDSLHEATSSATASSGTHLLLVAPIVVAALGSIAAGAFAYISKRRKRAKEQKAWESPMSTSTSPASSMCGS